ncbi:MAG TPA: hypothetical protein GX707_10340 [Epulopiscium sp.]|nr:hypothetical protein [Candidatus Epulonipiscium sp.]
MANDDKGTKTKLSDLNEYLFAQFEMLSNPDLKGDELKDEIRRSDALNKVAKNIINNGSLVLQAKRLSADVKGEYEKSKFLEG